MKKHLPKLYAPMIFMMVLLVLILVEQAGFMTDARPPVLAYLDQAALSEAHGEDFAAVPETLLLYNSNKAVEAAFVDQNLYMLESIAMPVVARDLAKEGLGDLTGIRTVLIATQELDALLNDVERLVNWVNVGGHLGLMITPAVGNVFNLISGTLGITETQGSYEEYNSLLFLTDLLPLFSGEVYVDTSLSDYVLAARLAEDCTVHIQTGDDHHLPILWERPLGQGRIAVFNAALLSEKANRALSLCVLFALEDEVVYPIINAGMVFIDDFPAPQPEGTDERLKEDYGYSIQGFFRNHWWPDMKNLVYQYGLRYTGVLVETYNTTVEPPFEPETEENVLLRYYASELMHAGGEIGLHGYNHMPLCLDGFVYNGDNYKTWPSVDNMAQSVKELVRYGAKVLPEASFVTYVPPSNYLSAEGKATLLATVPQIRTISGLYLNEDGVDALVQEFAEEADGSIAVPRITSGFDMNSYNWLVLAEELLYHGVFSHFIHPDDVLDEARGAVLGWDKMYIRFEESIQKLQAAYPALRYSTASEGAAAVQRYDRIAINREWENDHTLTLKLEGFVDEAWLALRTRDGNFTVEGGVGYPVNEHLVWIRAESPELRVIWGDKR